jgi:hypothetical protein
MYEKPAILGKEIERKQALCFVRAKNCVLSEKKREKEKEREREREIVIFV